MGPSTTIRPVWTPPAGRLLDRGSTSVHVAATATSRSNTSRRAPRAAAGACARRPVASISTRPVRRRPPTHSTSHPRSGVSATATDTPVHTRAPAAAGGVGRASGRRRGDRRASRCRSRSPGANARPARPRPRCCGYPRTATGPARRTDPTHRDPAAAAGRPGASVSPTRGRSNRLRSSSTTDRPAGQPPSRRCAGGATAGDHDVVHLTRSASGRSAAVRQALPRSVEVETEAAQPLFQLLVRSRPWQAGQQPAEGSPPSPAAAEPPGVGVVAASPDRHGQRALPDERPPRRVRPRARTRTR